MILSKIKQVAQHQQPVGEGIDVTVGINIHLLGKTCNMGLYFCGCFSYRVVGYSARNKRIVSEAKHRTHEQETVR